MSSCWGELCEFLFRGPNGYKRLPTVRQELKTIVDRDSDDSTCTAVISARSDSRKRGVSFHKLVQVGVAHSARDYNRTSAPMQEIIKQVSNIQEELKEVHKEFFPAKECVFGSKGQLVINDFERSALLSLAIGEHVEDDAQKVCHIRNVLDKLASLEAFL